MTATTDGRQKVLGALLTNALLRWETLVTLMVTAILFLFVQDVSLPFIEWQPWFWLVLGGLAETVLVASTLTDPEATEQALAEDFEREYDLRNIRNRVSRERLRDAFEYRRNMLKLADVARGAMRTRQRTLISGINDWIAHMYSLANRIDYFENNDLAARDLQQVPRKIELVKQRIETERDQGTRHDLQQQLKLLQRQLVSLEASASIIKRAEIQLESTLSALGTVYAQMSLLGTKDTKSIRGQRLGIEIKEEIDKLQDTIDAMDEVQLHGQALNFDFNDDLFRSEASALEEAEDQKRQRLSTADDAASDLKDELAALDAAERQMQNES
ncbi:MAG: hypothetical protein OXG78_07170 [Chloroflexi bacterium]|nr:hypothetical protein [Chloroflexota bacterium]